MSSVPSEPQEAQTVLRRLTDALACGLAAPGLRHLWFGAIYFCVAAVPIALARLGGGVAFVWIASALLTARLITTERRGWLWWLVAAGGGSVIATGLFGMGWAAAPVLMLLNLCDALIATMVLSRVLARHGALSAERDVPVFVLACLAGAVSTAVPAAFVAHYVSGVAVWPNALSWIVGHACGTLTFGPFMHLALRGQMLPWLKRLFTGGDGHSLIAVILLAMASAAPFVMHDFSLLFLPVLGLVALTYREGTPGAAFGAVVLSLTGMGLTLAGFGVIQFGSVAETFQFYQFFLGTTTVAMLPVAMVISARADMTQRLRHSEAGYRLIADNIDDVVVRFDLDGRLTYLSPSIAHITGRVPQDLLDSSALDLIDPEYHARLRDAWRRMVAAPGVPVTCEFVGRAAGDRPRWFELHGRCLADQDGQPAHIVATIRETTERKVLEQALTSAAEIDPLTGLLNRRAFFDAVRITARAGADHCLVLFDLDHLQAINTIIGNAAGDRVVSAFADVCRASVRERDLLGRLEGDMFAVLMPGTPREGGEAVSRRVLTAFAAKRIVHEGRPIVVSASAGLAGLGDDLDAALRVAHAVLAQAKRSGGARLICAA